MPERMAGRSVIPFLFRLLFTLGMKSSGEGSVSLGTRLVFHLSLALFLFLQVNNCISPRPLQHWILFYFILSLSGERRRRFHHQFIVYLLFSSVIGTVWQFLVIHHLLVCALFSLSFRWLLSLRSFLPALTKKKNSPKEMLCFPILFLVSSCVLLSISLFSFC